MLNRLHCIATLVAMAGTLGIASAQDGDRDRPQPETRRPMDDHRREGKIRSESEDQKHQGVYLVRSTRVEGVTVTDSEGTTVGRVHDTIVRGTSGRVVYVLVTRGVPAAYPTAPEKAGPVVPVPFAAFNWDEERKALAMNITEEQFKAASTLDADQWRTLSEPARSKTTYNYFRIPDDRATEDRKVYTYKRTTTSDGRNTEVKEETTTTTKVKPSNPDNRRAMPDDRRVNPDDRRGDDTAMNRTDQEGSLFRASEIQNKPMISREGKQVALVNDVIFDATSGRIAFLAITPDSTMDAGEGQIAVPWPSFEVDQSGRLFALDMDRETLRAAPRLTQTDWTELRNDGYTQDMYKRFGYESTQWDRAAERRSSRGNSWQKPYRTVMASGTPRTITGKVESIEECAGKDGTPGVMVVNVRTDEGETVAVHTAPQANLDEHKMALRKGDVVTVRGKTVDMDGKHCLCATEVSMADGKRVVLYSSDDDSK